MPDIYFSKMSSLSKDLKTFLLGIGYSPRQLEFIDKKGKTNISRKEGQGYKGFYSGELMEFVSDKERYLLHFCKVLDLELD